MVSASRAPSIVLMALLAMAAPSQCFGRALVQQDTGVSTGQGDKASKDSTAGKANKNAQSSQQPNPTEANSSKTEENVDNKAQAGSQPGQANEPSKDAAPTAGGADKKGKSSQHAKQAQVSSSKNDKKVKSKVPADAQSGPSNVAAAVTSPAFQNAAKQVLQSLDAAIDIAQKAGVPAPAAWQNKGKGGTALFVAKRSELQHRVDAAKDEQAWAGVATDAAAALTDILKAIVANPSYWAANSQPAATTLEPADVPKTPEPKLSFWSYHLPIYLAGLSLVFSVLALWTGWFLARREINKALIEAGLM